MHDLDRLVRLIKSGEKGGVRIKNGEFVFNFGYRREYTETEFLERGLNSIPGVIPHEYYSVYQYFVCEENSASALFLKNHSKTNRYQQKEGNKLKNMLELEIGCVRLSEAQIKPFLQGIVTEESVLYFYTSS